MNLQGELLKNYNVIQSFPCISYSYWWVSARKMLAMELYLSCTNPSIYSMMIYDILFLGHDLFFLRETKLSTKTNTRQNKMKKHQYFHRLILMITSYAIHITSWVSDNQAKVLTWLESNQQSCPPKEPIENPYYGIWWKNVANWLMDPIKQWQCITQVHSVSDLLWHGTVYYRWKGTGWNDAKFP